MLALITLAGTIGQPLLYRARTCLQFSQIDLLTDTLTDKANDAPYCWPSLSITNMTSGNLNVVSQNYSIDADATTGQSEGYGNPCPSADGSFVLQPIHSYYGSHPSDSWWVAKMPTAQTTPGTDDVPYTYCKLVSRDQMYRVFAVAAGGDGTATSLGVRDDGTVAAGTVNLSTCDVRWASLSGAPTALMSEFPAFLWGMPEVAETGHRFFGFHFANPEEGQRLIDAPTPRVIGVDALTGTVLNTTVPLAELLPADLLQSMNATYGLVKADPTNEVVMLPIYNRESPGINYTPTHIILYHVRTSHLEVLAYGFVAGGLPCDRLWQYAFDAATRVMYAECYSEVKDPRVGGAFRFFGYDVDTNMVTVVSSTPRDPGNDFRNICHGPSSQPRQIDYSAQFIMTGGQQNAS